MSMSEIEIRTDNDVTRLAPGEILAGSVRWNLLEPPRSIDLRLMWYTQGKGDGDVGVVDSITFDNPAQYESRRFQVQLPNGPYSFSGKLIALIWALEAVVQPRDRFERLEIVVSPTRREIALLAPQPQ